MPPAIVAALIGAGVAGTTTGLEASGVIGGGGGPSQSTLNAEQEQNNAQQVAQQQQLIKAAAPNVQANTGGSLTDNAFAQMVADLAGTPGDIGLAQQTLYGNQSTGLASGG